jgi:hypothetical protein
VDNDHTSNKKLLRAESIAEDEFEKLKSEEQGEDE